MIRIKSGTCGTSQGYKTAADGALSLPAAEEKRLVSRGVADYVTRPIIGEAPDTPPGGGEPPAPPQEEPPAEAATGGNEGNPDAAEVARLERMSKDDLVQMAQDMGVDISAAKNNHERAVLIVAAGEPETPDTPPEFGMGDIVP